MEWRTCCVVRGDVGRERDSDFACMNCVELYKSFTRDAIFLRFSEVGRLSLFSISVTLLVNAWSCSMYLTAIC